jgi:hypothetical protein
LDTAYPRPAIDGKVKVLTGGAFFPFTLTDADIAEAELRLTKDIAQFKPATWAEANDTTRSDAIRRLVDLGLGAKGK